jgi:hypothetical protein
MYGEKSGENGESVCMDTRRTQAKECQKKIASSSRKMSGVVNLIAFLLAEEACRMLDSTSGGKRRIFSPKMQPTWDAQHVVTAGCDALLLGAGSCSRCLQHCCA